MLRDVIIFCLVAASVTAETDTVQKFSEANEKLTKALFEQIRNEEGNLFFSPLSVELFLALTHASTAGKTASQIQQAYHLPETKEKSAKFYSTLLESLTSNRNITFNFFNGIFLDKKFPIARDSRDLAKNGYRFKTYVVNEDFSESEETRVFINRFVAKRTGDKIKDVLSPNSLDAETASVLLNAIYFKGDWLHKFNPIHSKPQIFFKKGGERWGTFLQTIAKSFPFAENKDLDAKIVKIPYKGETVSMLLIVPNTNEGLDHVESKIANINLNELTKNLHSRDVRITMPKFKLEEELDIKKILQKMGITDIFTPGTADFSRISGLFVSKAWQKSVFELNEETTPVLTYNPLPPVEIIANRPFLFFVVHNPTGLRLFMGRVASPIGWPFTG